MANFTTYSKLQLIVTRADLGADNVVNGDYGILVAVTGSVTAAGTIDILGIPVTINVGDSASSVVINAATSTQVPGRTAAAHPTKPTILEVDYTDPQVLPFPATPVTQSELGLTLYYTVVDNRDRTQVLKHSEYVDDVDGLGVATAAMFDLVAGSPVTDSVQLKRVSLTDTDEALVEEDLTQVVVGKAYVDYTE